MPIMPHSPRNPVEGIAIRAGLLCSHPKCNSFFATLEDSNGHAREHHSGVVQAITCAVQELQNTSGEVELLLVRDTPGELG